MSLNEKLDALRPKEEAFREEVRARRQRPWGRTVELPKGRGDMRAFTNGVLKSIHDFGSRPEPAVTWPEGGPMTSDESFDPQPL